MSSLTIILYFAHRHHTICYHKRIGHISDRVDKNLKTGRKTKIRKRNERGDITGRRCIVLLVVVFHITYYIQWMCRPVEMTHEIF